MTTMTIARRSVTGGLVTMLLASGAALADATPLVEPPTASSVRSGAVSALAPQPLASSDATEPWSYDNLIAFPPAGTLPLKPADDALPKTLETRVQPALPEVQVPATVRNLRRADGR